MAGEPAGKDVLVAVFSNLTELRINQDKVSWEVFAIFNGANAILINALLGVFRLSKEEIVGRSVTLLVAVGAGIVLSWIWVVVEGRMIKHLERFEDLTERVEDKLEVPVELRTTKRNVDAYRRASLQPAGAARAVLTTTPLITLILWATAFVAVWVWVLVVGCARY